MYEYLSIISSVLIILGYLPEYYIMIKTKEAKIESSIIWIIWTSGSLLTIIYGLLNDQYYLMTSQYTVFGMNLLTLILKIYYIYYNIDNKIYIEKNNIEENKNQIV